MNRLTADVRNNTLVMAVIIAVAIISIIPSAALSNCHCFKDRSFDPMQPASADPYVLATARNSLVAAASDMAKGQVVKMRMTGATETDVWLSMYLESPGGKKDAAALGLNTAGKAWDRDAVAEALANRVLARTYKAEVQALAELRASGADTAGVTLSLFVASLIQKAPGDIFAEVRDGKTTWGKAVSSLGIPLDTTGDRIMADVIKAVQ